MKHKYINLRHIILCICLLAGIKASAYDAEIDGIYYIFSDTTAIVTYQSYSDDYTSDYSGAVVVPGSVTYNDKNYTVKSIGYAAFWGCSDLISVTIPSSVTNIDSYAFRNCTCLNSINIPDGVIYIDWGTFSGCTSLTSVTIPNRVKEIDRYAFEGCSSLTSVTLPDSLETIKDRAFYNTGLTDVTIPNSVLNMGVEVFDGTPWLDNQPDGMIYLGQFAYKYKGTMPEGTHLSINEGTIAISGSAFAFCSGLSSITIPESVTNIGPYAFLESGLTSVTIPNNVSIIGIGAFHDCTSLTTAIIDGGIVIEDDAFCDCINLTSVTFGDNLWYIDRDAFSGTGLTSITIPKSTTYILPPILSNCNALTSIIVEDDNPCYDSRDNCNAIIEGNTLIQGCKSTIIPESVTRIGKSAFYMCAGLTSITIPKSVNSIGEDAFYYCTCLKEIYCYAEETPEVSTSTFYGIDVSKVLLVVPESAVEKYKVHPVWGQFHIETPTGIKALDDVQGIMQDEVFNLAGQRIDRVQRGINIIDGKKILMK